MSIKVTCYPRIHVTLIGMDKSGYRHNGGVGFAVREPNANVSFALSSNTHVQDTRDKPFQNEELARIEEVIEDARVKCNLPYGVRCLIDGDMPTHSGFGSSTAIRLACLEGLFKVNKVRVEKDVLISLSRRGGTSGIGVQTYFTGGCVFDMGHRNAVPSAHRPSSSAEARPGRPLLVRRFKMSPWKIGLVLPHDITPLTEEEEKAFFQRTCPVSSSDVSEALYHTVYGFLGGVLDNDSITVSAAINAIQRTAWKSAEIDIYGCNLRERMQRLSIGDGTGVGMSSLGPCIYAISKGLKSITASVRGWEGTHSVWVTNPVNHGRRWVNGNQSTGGRS